MPARLTEAERCEREVRRRSTPTEAQFQARTEKLARTLGYRVYHTRFSIGSDRGFPDLYMVRRLDGRTIAAELKVEDEPVTPDQQGWLDDMAKNPHVETYLWRWTWPGDVEREIAQVLAR